MKVFQRFLIYVISLTSFSLLIIGYNLKNLEGDRAFSRSVDISNYSNIEEYYAYSAWSSLIDDLNINGYAKLSNYNVDRNIFLGNGWTHQHRWGDAPYAIVAYSKPSGSRNILTQLSLVDVVTQKIMDSATINFSIGASPNNMPKGALVEYDPFDDMLTTLQHGAGLSFSNVELDIGGLSGNNIFISRSVSSHTRSSYNMFLLNRKNRSVHNHRRLFDRSGNNEAHRRIYISTGSDKLSSNGDFINLEGNIKGSSHKVIFSYKYTAHSHLR